MGAVSFKCGSFWRCFTVLTRACVYRHRQLDWEAIAIESHPNCEYDYVEVLNGPLLTSPSIARFCGSNATSVRSASNALRVSWHSDGSGSDTGFRINYRFDLQGQSILFARSVVFFMIGCKVSR